MLFSVRRTDGGRPFGGLETGWLETVCRPTFQLTLKGGGQSQLFGINIVTTVIAGMT